MIAVPLLAVPASGRMLSKGDSAMKQLSEAHHTGHIDRHEDWLPDVGADGTRERLCDRNPGGGG